MSHEISQAFCNAGFPLRRSLVQMLDEHFSHQTDRRGCGFTQATRFLSTYINQPACSFNPGDLSVFDDWPINATGSIAKKAVDLGWSQGWRRLHQIPPELKKSLPNNSVVNRLTKLLPAIDAIINSVALPESILLLNLLRDLLTRDGRSAPNVLGMPIKPEIGSCSQAEEFFLEIAHRRVRRRGTVNIIVADDGSPVMVEKMNLGESHSAIVVAPINIFGIWIPPGGLCALQYRDKLSSSQQTKHGQVVYLSDIAEARFLRLTTLAVAPEYRQRTFSAQVEAQVRGQMLSPLTTTIEQMREFAQDELTSVAA